MASSQTWHRDSFPQSLQKATPQILQEASSSVLSPQISQIESGEDSFNLHLLIWHT